MCKWHVHPHAQHASTHAQHASTHAQHASTHAQHASTHAQHASTHAPCRCCPLPLGVCPGVQLYLSPPPSHMFPLHLHTFCTTAAAVTSLPVPLASRLASLMSRLALCRTLHPSC